MLVPPSDKPASGDLQPLCEAIDTLCEILEGDREAVIAGLAEIVRKRAEFERCRQAHGHCWRLRLIPP